MFGSSALDVAIGLAFLYLLLSLLCTALNELLEAAVQKRGEFLRDGIAELLGVTTDRAAGGTWVYQMLRWCAERLHLVARTPAAPAPDGLVARVYTHPFVASLYSGRYGTETARLPSYIPSRQFALALLDLVLPANSRGANRSGAAFAAAAVAPAADAAAGQVQALRAAVADAATGVSDEVRTALLALIDAAGDDLNQVRDNIEKWYDGTMDRVAGWYRRRVQYVSAAFGVVLAVSLNADTFAIGDSLSRDQALRTSVVSAAEAYSKAHPQPPAPDPNVKDQPAQDGETPKVKDALKNVSDGVNEVRGFGWPLGWDRNDPRTIPRVGKDDNVWRAIGAWLLKALGWVLTATAISLGAPFWFDLLNRLIVVRSTVKPTEKSPPEPSADKK